MGVPDNIANYFALGTEMHGVWAMFVGQIVSRRAGDAAFGAVIFAFFPLLLATVFGWAREPGLGRDWTWLAAAILAGVPTAFEVAGSGYVGLALALYVTLAIRSLARWWDTQDRASLAESALAVGFALSVKLTAWFVVFVSTLIVLGITHVLIRHDILFDYAQSPLVDDERPRADNLARIERLRSFLADGTRVLRADRKFALVELGPSSEPVPPGSQGADGRHWALSRGIK